MGHDDDKRRQLVRDAEHAFWEVIAKGNPEAKSGDFPPDADFAFTEACDKAVETWIEYNVPKPRTRLLEKLEADLFELRRRYNLGSNTADRNIAAALLESFGSFVSCIAGGDETESAIEGLTNTVQNDFCHHHDAKDGPADELAALAYVTTEFSEIPDVPGHLTLTKGQVTDIVEQLYAFQCRPAGINRDATFEAYVRTDGATSLPALREILDYYFANTDWKQEGK